MKSTLPVRIYENLDGITFSLAPGERSRFPSKVNRVFVADVPDILTDAIRIRAVVELLTSTAPFAGRVAFYDSSLKKRGELILQGAP